MARKVNNNDDDDSRSRDSSSVIILRGFCRPWTAVIMMEMTVHLKSALNIHCGGRDNLVLKRRTRDRKVASSNPGRSGGRIFFSRVNFVCWLLFDIRSTPVLPQWHVKDPDRSAESVCVGLHLNTLTPWTQRKSEWADSTRWATVNWSWPMEWNKCARGNLHFKKKKKKRRRGMNCRTFSQNRRKRWKKPYH